MDHLIQEHHADLSSYRSMPAPANFDICLDSGEILDIATVDKAPAERYPGYSPTEYSEIEKVTQKAILFWNTSGDKKSWVPLSCVEGPIPREWSEDGVFYVREDFKFSWFDNSSTPAWQKRK